MKENSRRRFLKGTLGTLSGSLLARVAGLFPEAGPLLARSPQETVHVAQPSVQADVGELYAGFLLLAEDAPLPESVQSGRTINLHGHGERAGQTIQFNNAEELRSYISFPIFIPKTLPKGFQLVDTSIIQYVETGAIWAVQTSYGILNTNFDVLESRISLWAYKEFSRPLPIWPVHDANDTVESIVLPEKVTYSPLPPGVLLPSAQSHMFQWIYDDIYYVLIAERDKTREAIRTIARSLVQI